MKNNNETFMNTFTTIALQIKEMKYKNVDEHWDSNTKLEA